MSKTDLIAKLAQDLRVEGLDANEHVLIVADALSDQGKNWTVKMLVDNGHDAEVARRQVEAEVRAIRSRGGEHFTGGNTTMAEFKAMVGEQMGEAEWSKFASLKLATDELRLVTIDDNGFSIAITVVKAAAPNLVFLP